MNINENLENIKKVNKEMEKVDPMHASCTLGSAIFSCFFE